MPKTYEVFAADLRASIPHIFRFARWVHDHEYAVTIPPTIIRPKYSNPEDYADNGDIFIKKHGIVQKINVKCNYDVDFTDKHWPLPGSLVVPPKDLEKERYKDMHAHVILHPTKNYAASINFPETREHWSLKTYYDRRYGRWMESYWCPKHLIKLHAF